MLAIADEFERLGLDPKTSSLRIGIFGAEPWTNDMRAAIEKRMAIDAVDIYGLSEVMGPGVASECIETKDGPTIWEDHFYPEIIDPETGEPVADGEMGELVFTSLTKEALPIIRYRTRDLTRLLPGTARPSMRDLTRLLPGTARSMRRMEKITGRSDDMMIIRGVNVFPSQIEELILKRAELAPHYQCVLTREGPMDDLKVLIETKPGVSPDSMEARAAAKQLQHEIKVFIGSSVAIELKAEGGVERSQGKAKRVVDLRGK
jgi:phenylacetate-CoA ligase